MEGGSQATALTVPELPLGNDGGRRRIPALGLGTASSPPVGPEATKRAVLEAIRVGYRHFDTAALYGSEEPLGEAISEALSLGLIQSRHQLFITSKLWCADAHPHLVLPALQKSLRNLNLEYINLYLIHWPVSSKPGIIEFPIMEEDFLPLDFSSVWAAMEECQNSGLTESIGVSNFSCKKIDQILEIAKIPPVVNQVELNPCWQQKKLKQHCAEKGIILTAYAALGAAGTVWGSNRVLESQLLQDIATAKGKTVAQICLRWAYEQGASVLMKSFNPERLKQNLDIFNWSLTMEETAMITSIPQSRGCLGQDYISRSGPYKTIEELWDGEL